MKRTSHYTGEVIDLVRSGIAREDEVLQAARDRAVSAGLPLIEVEPEAGALLALLVRLMRPQLVVEVGTLFGYSAIWMARALAGGGRLVTIEREPGHAAIAKENLAAAGLADRAEVRVGDAAAVLAGISSPVDMVFVDADKPAYPAYLEWARGALRPGGLFAADNAFQGGRVAQPPAGDAGAAAVHAMLADLDSDPAWAPAVVPTLEGLALAVRV